MVTKEAPNYPAQDEGTERKRAVVLLSGGLDSAVTAWIAKSEVEEIYALSFNYGQSHSREIRSAQALAHRLGAKEHKILDLPISYLVGKASSLFDKESIPKEGLTEGIPSTWVPQRNAIFLAFSFGWAEVVGADKVYIGVNAVDYSGYPDCRPHFIASINGALNLASRKFVEEGYGIGIVTPIIGLKKREIVATGYKLRVPFELTWSCYSGEEEACGLCDSCRIRRKAFEDLGLVDPIKYKE